MKFLLFIGIFSLLVIEVSGQITPTRRDTTITEEQPLISEQDENINIEEIEMYADQFVPRKASLYSAVLPGLGQAYNKNYWKIPIIYGGFVALGLTVDFYNDQYQVLRRDLFALLENDLQTTPIGFSEEQVRGQIDNARRERDFYMIMIGVLYFLQIAEAHIDAHLKEFKLNPELRVSIEPTIDRPAFSTGNTAGISLKFKF